MSEPTTRESRSSIELHRHKDGTYFWSIKIYFGDDEDLGDVISALETTDRRLRDHHVVEVAHDR